MPGNTTNDRTHICRLRIQIAALQPAATSVMTALRGRTPRATASKFLPKVLRGVQQKRAATA